MIGIAKVDVRKMQKRASKPKCQCSGCEDPVIEAYLTASEL